MGLQGQLSDVSSENILVLVTVVIARSARYLRSAIFAILHGLGLLVQSQIHNDHHNYVADTASFSLLDDVVGSGLSGVVILCEQLNLSRVFSYHQDRLDDQSSENNCVVCLNRMEHGDHVRQLPCSHVFHSDCLDGWLIHRLNFSCPLCHAPSVSDAYADEKRRRVAVDLLTWFDSTADRSY